MRIFTEWCRDFLVLVGILTTGLHALALGGKVFPEHYHFFAQGDTVALSEAFRAHVDSQHACQSEAWFNALELALIMDDRAFFLGQIGQCPSITQPDSRFQRVFSPHLQWDSLLLEASRVFGGGEQVESIVWKGLRAELRYSVMKAVNRSERLTTIDLPVTPGFDWAWALAFGVPVFMLLVALVWTKRSNFNSLAPISLRENPNQTLSVLQSLQDQIESGSFSPHYALQLSHLEFEFNHSTTPWALDSNYASLTHQQRLIVHFAANNFGINEVADYLAISRGYLYNERSSIKRVLALDAQSSLNSEARRWMESMQQQLQ